jgi:hypothetical protein
MSAAQPILPFDDDPARHDIGGNNPPDAFRMKRAEVEEALGAQLKGLDVWSKRETLDADTAPRALDFQKGLKLLKKEADEARTAEKKPHDEAAKAVQAYWKDIEAKLDKALLVITPKLAAWQKVLDEQKRAAEAAARAKREAAEREAETARAAAAHAESESARIAAEALAEATAQQAREAAKVEKAAAGPARIASATGLANRTGTRKETTATITDRTRAVLYFRNTDQVLDLIERLALAAARAAPIVDGVKQLPEIPGIAFSIEEKFV